jgi:predicted transcriptional regulator
VKFESEVITEELLPAVRSVMASQLQEEYGLNQYEIAEVLDVTQPAVSQYLNNKRARKNIVEDLKEDPQTGIMLNDAVNKAAKEESFTEELRQIVSTVRDKGLMKEEFKEVERIL